MKGKNNRKIFDSAQQTFDGLFLKFRKVKILFVLMFLIEKKNVTTVFGTINQFKNKVYISGHSLSQCAAKDLENYLMLTKFICYFFLCI